MRNPKLEIMKNALLSKTSQKLAILALMTFMSLSAMAQLTYTDSVCAGTQDKVYGIMNSEPTSIYAWWLSDPTAGTIDNSIAPNDSLIEIDWGLTPGTYTLYSVETSLDGCIGDTVQLDIIVHPLPTALVVSDSVCENFSATLTFDLTGQAPWTIDYTDGTNNFTAVANATPFTISTPPYTSSQTITVTGVTDGYSCAADPAGLPSTPVHIYPRPTTGAIYHY